MEIQKTNSKSLTIFRKRPEELIQIVKNQNLTIEEIFQNNCGQLNIIAREAGINHLKIAITNLIIDVVKWFNQTEPMSLNQCGECANFIYEDWNKFLTLEDLVLCFKNVKKKLYKKEDKNWARIQPTDILYWARVYAAEKETKIIEINSTSRKIKIQNEIENKIDDNQFNENMKNLKKTISQIGKIKNTTMYIPQRDKNQQAHQKYNYKKQLFNEILKNQNSKDELIELNGERITFNQYLLK